MNVRPAAFFYIKCNLLPEAVINFYDRAQDGYESTGLFALPKVSSSCITFLSIGTFAMLPVIDVMLSFVIIDISWIICLIRLATSSLP